MSATVTLKGEKFSLKGNLVKEGQTAPDCTVVGKDLKPVKLSSFRGKPLLLLSVPSLDTAVCSRETHRFNEELAKQKGPLSVVCVSMDLPFAQSRWCTAEKVDNVTLLSDYRYREFGEKFGVLISDLGLLARAVFLIDPEMKVVKVHLVKEVTEEPPYDEILKNLQQITTAKR